MSTVNDPHVRPLTEIVNRLRSTGRPTPDVDPNDGGVDARVLVLLETPGPQAHASGFVSMDNEDNTAANMKDVLTGANIARKDVVLWNAVPYYQPGIAAQNQNATPRQARDAIQTTQNFLDAIQRLQVVVFCGGAAKAIRKRLTAPDSRVIWLETYYTSQRAFRGERAEHVRWTFSAVARLLADDSGFLDTALRSRSR